MDPGLQGDLITEPDFEFGEEERSRMWAERGDGKTIMLRLNDFYEYSSSLLLGIFHLF